MKLALRPAALADAGALAALDAVCNPGPWSEAAFLSHLRASPPNAALVLATGPAVLAAFCAYRLCAPELEILQTGTAPEQRRRGLARLLLGRALEHGRRAGAEVALLDVRAENAAARALYAALGFAPAGCRPSYYHDPEDDAVLLRCAIGAGLEIGRRPVLASSRIDGLTSECGPMEVEMTELLENEEYRRLADEHHGYEARLLVLTDKIVLSDEEQLEEATLKKKKLQLKDRMESIAREHRTRAH